jgi:hypothetical protein
LSEGKKGKAYVKENWKWEMAKGKAGKGEEKRRNLFKERIILIFNPADFTSSRLSIPSY